MILSLRTRRSRTPTRGTGIERKRRRNGRGAEGRSGWRQSRVSAGGIHSRDQAGRQSPAGHRSRAREGTRCVPAKKTPDDSCPAPMDEAFSPRFRCRASTGGKNLRGHRIPACRKARCRVRIDAGRSTRQPDRTGVRPGGDTGKARRDYHAVFRAADGRARLGGNAASPPQPQTFPQNLT